MVRSIYTQVFDKFPESSENDDLIIKRIQEKLSDLFAELKDSLNLQFKLQKEKGILEDLIREQQKEFTSIQGEMDDMKEYIDELEKGHDENSKDKEDRIYVQRDQFENLKVEIKRLNELCVEQEQEINTSKSEASTLTLKNKEMNKKLIQRDAESTKAIEGLKEVLQSHTLMIKELEDHARLSSERKTETENIIERLQQVISRVLGITDQEVLELSDDVLTERADRIKEIIELENSRDREPHKDDGKIMLLEESIRQLQSELDVYHKSNDKQNIEEKENINAQLKLQIKQVQKENDDLKQKIKLLQDSSSSNSGQTSSPDFESKLQAAKQDSFKKDQIISNFKNQMHYLHSLVKLVLDIKLAISSTNPDQKDFEWKSQKLKQLMNDFERTQAKLDEKTVAQILSQIPKPKPQGEDTQVLLSQKEKEIVSLNEEVLKYKQQLSQIKEELDKLSTENSIQKEKDNEILSLKSQILYYKSQFTELQQELENSEVEYRALEEDSQALIAEKDTLICELNEQIINHKKENTQLQDEMKQTIEKLNAEVNSKEHLLEEKNVQIEDLSSQIAQCKEQLLQQQEELNKYIKDYDGLNNELNCVNDSISKFETLTEDIRVIVLDKHVVKDPILSLNRIRILLGYQGDLQAGKNDSESRLIIHKLEQRITQLENELHKQKSPPTESEVNSSQAFNALIKEMEELKQLNKNIFSQISSEKMRKSQDADVGITTFSYQDMAKIYAILYKANLSRKDLLSVQNYLHFVENENEDLNLRIRKLLQEKLLIIDTLNDIINTSNEYRLEVLVSILKKIDMIQQDASKLEKMDGQINQHEMFHAFNLMLTNTFKYIESNIKLLSFKEDQNTSQILSLIKIADHEKEKEKEKELKSYAITDDKGLNNQKKNYSDIKLELNLNRRTLVAERTNLSQKNNTTSHAIPIKEEASFKEEQTENNLIDPLRDDNRKTPKDYPHQSTLEINARRTSVADVKKPEYQYKLKSPQALQDDPLNDNTNHFQRDHPLVFETKNDVPVNRTPVKSHTKHFNSSPNNYNQQTLDYQNSSFIPLANTQQYLPKNSPELNILRRSSHSSFINDRFPSYGTKEQRENEKLRQIDSRLESLEKDINNLERGSHSGKIQNRPFAYHESSYRNSYDYKAPRYSPNGIARTSMDYRKQGKNK